MQSCTPKRDRFQQAQLQQLHNQAQLSYRDNKIAGYKSAMVDKGIRFQLTKDHSLHPQIKQSIYQWDNKDYGLLSIVNFK